MQRQHTDEATATENGIHEDVTSDIAEETGIDSNLSAAEQGGYSVGEQRRQTSFTSSHQNYPNQDEDITVIREQTITRGQPSNSGRSQGNERLVYDLDGKIVHRKQASDYQNISNQLQRGSMNPDHQNIPRSNQNLKRNPYVVDLTQDDVQITGYTPIQNDVQVTATAEYRVCFGMFESYCFTHAPYTGRVTFSVDLEWYLDDQLRPVAPIEPNFKKLVVPLSKHCGFLMFMFMEHSPDLLVSQNQIIREMHAGMTRSDSSQRVSQNIQRSSSSSSVQSNPPILNGSTHKKQSFSDPHYQKPPSIPHTPLVPPPAQAQHTNQPFAFIKILLSGKISVGAQLGAYLGSHKIQLVEPDIVSNLAYKNPQIQEIVQQIEKVDPQKSQIDALYQSFTSASDLPLTEPNTKLLSTLYKHQKQALYFMMQRETPVEVGTKQSFWRKVNNGYRNVLTDTVQSSIPCQILGGIVADDMGVGKTIQVISLILSLPALRPVIAPYVEEEEEIQKFSFGFVKPKPKMLNLDLCGKVASKTTLIVCPLSTVSNWEDQLSVHTAQGALSVYVYHGPNREPNPTVLAAYDVVITTYNILAVSMGKNGKGLMSSVLHAVYWYRVVLDEAHIIKTVNTVQAKAAHALQAERRWCLSGTPIQNKIDDLYSLVKFIRVQPLDVRGKWTLYISKSIKQEDSIAVKRLQTMMKLLTLRRTKNQMIDGKPIIDLPPKKEMIYTITLGEIERKRYNQIRQRAKLYFEGLQRSGTVLKNYMHILDAILRMRQACTNLKLIKNDEWLTNGIFN